MQSLHASTVSAVKAMYAFGSGLCKSSCRETIHQYFLDIPASRVIFDTEIPDGYSGKCENCKLNVGDFVAMAVRGIKY